MNVFFVSLGCDKNLVDSEYMLGILRSRGYDFTDDEAEADVIVVNSCCFIGDAKEESINTILEMAQYRTADDERCRALIVAGCLAQRYADEIRTEIPEVDAIVGTTAYDTIADVIDRVLGGEHVRELESIDRPVSRVRYDLLIMQYQSTRGSEWNPRLRTSRVHFGDINDGAVQLGNVLNLNLDVIGAFGLHFAGELQAAISESKAKVFASSSKIRRFSFPVGTASISRDFLPALAPIIEDLIILFPRLLIAVEKSFSVPPFQLKVICFSPTL